MGSANDRETYLLSNRSLMLASPQPKGLSPTEYIDQVSRQNGWTFDIKWDGVRCLAYCEGNAGVTLQNRNGVDITHRYPDIALMLGAVTADYGRIVLDGEIVVFAEDGKPDFSLIAKRDRVGSKEKAEQAMLTLPATFIAFDLLDFNGTDLKGVTYEARRAMLEVHFSDASSSPHMFTLSPTSDNGQAMWNLVQRLGIEGLIAKRNDGLYVPYRSADWIKVKDTRRISCIVTGTQDGTGSKEGMVGALLLGLIGDDSTLVDVGKVGTGFTDDDRRKLQRYFDDLPEYSPHEMGALVVEVEYLNLTNDGKLRFPSFKGLRSDVDAGDCTTDQLDRT